MQLSFVDVTDVRADILTIKDSLAGPPSATIK